MHKNIKLLAWFNFFLDFRFYAPVAIIYFAKISGSYALGMSVFSATTLSSALLEIPTGIFSDRIGRKNTIVLGATATLISVILYAIGGNYRTLIIGALFEGLARAFYSGNNDALLHDSLTENSQSEDYSEYKGKTSSTAQVALALTAISGSIIASRSFSLVMWLSIIPALMGLFISFKIAEPKISKTLSGNIYAHLGESFRNFLKNKRLRMLSLSTSLGYAQGEAGWLFRSAFNATLWPVWAIGFAQALSNISSASSFYFGGKLVKKFGAFKILFTGKVYALLTNVIAVLMSNVLSPLLLASNSVFFGAGNVSKSTLMQKEYSPGERATMDSLNSFFGNVAFAIISLGLGFVADLLNPAKALLYLQTIAFITLLILWNLYIKEYKGKSL
mgnify:CR=1 FL=1